MDLADYKEQFEKPLEHLKEEISGLRTGRATPALVEDVIVEAYGSKQAVKALASISVQDAKTIVVEPWDKGILLALESGMRNCSTLGINPVNDGDRIRLILPDLTSERRADLIKVLHTKLEQSRISIRKIREDVRGDIEKAMKAKEISEDDKYDLQKELDEAVKMYNERIKTIGEEKEVEINKI